MNTNNINPIHVRLMVMDTKEEIFWQSFQGVQPMLWIMFFFVSIFRTFPIAWISIKSIACRNIVFAIPKHSTLDIKMANRKFDNSSVFTNISINFQIYAGQEDKRYDNEDLTADENEEVQEEIL